MKRLKKQPARLSGFSLTELIVALSVLGLLLTLFGMSLHQTRCFSHAQWTRQHCIAAAQAQLDSLSVKQPLTTAEAKHLWPRVDLATRHAPGLGSWQGLTLVTVKASSHSYRQAINVTLSRYLDLSVAQSGGGS